MRFLFLNLVIKEDQELFTNTPPLEPSPLLKEFLAKNANLALKINPEKARSEMIIAPILLDLKSQAKNPISLFSGVDFNVDSEQGLNGTRDFLIKNPKTLFSPKYRGKCKEDWN